MMVTQLSCVISLLSCSDLHRCPLLRHGSENLAEEAIHPVIRSLFLCQCSHEHWHCRVTHLHS
jgi:hypothetical protein